jgi:hypothetical protein
VVRVGLPDRTANVAAHDRINAAIVSAVDGGPGTDGRARPVAVVEWHLLRLAILRNA